MAGYSEWVCLCLGCSHDGCRRRIANGPAVLWAGKGEEHCSTYPMEGSHTTTTGVCGTYACVPYSNCSIHLCTVTLPQYCLWQVVCSLEYPDEVSGALLTWEYHSRRQPWQHRTGLERSFSVPPIPTLPSSPPPIPTPSLLTPPIPIPTPNHPEPIVQCKSI